MFFIRVYLCASVDKNISLPAEILSPRECYAITHSVRQDDSYKGKKNAPQAKRRARARGAFDEFKVNLLSGFHGAHIRHPFALLPQRADAVGFVQTKVVFTDGVQQRRLERLDQGHVAQANVRVG